MNMSIVTTTRAGGKPFSWSYSRLKNFETCPKRHYEVDILKNVKDDTDQLDWGNAVHKGIAERISKGTPLPRGMEPYEPWCERILQNTLGGNILVEQKLAINADFGACAFFDKGAWYRSVADVLNIAGDVALAVDWKTGKILEDAVQLALTASCVFAHYPEVRKIRTEFVWLKENASSRADFARADMVAMWKGVWPRIQALEHAYKTTSFPAKPGFLCRRFCPVASCPHHGT